VKTLHLLRHAKSDWDNPDLSDEQRPLNARGKRDAKRLARHLELHPIEVELILCSPALRARKTLQAIRPALRGAVWSEEKAIYAASADQLLRLTRRLPKGVDSVLLIGHNPGFDDLTSTLLPEGKAPAAFPTAALATLTFETDDWKSVAPGTATLAGFLTPADLRA
jgi:phosphohistidine phosphatase